MYEKRLDKKDMVNCKIHHASQPGLQTIAIHILPNILQNKVNQLKKFGQLIEYNKRNIYIFFKNYAENEERRLVSDLFLFFEKT